MNRPRILVVLSLLFTLLSFPAQGQVGSSRKATGPVDITARELKYNREQNIYTAEGDVEIREGARRLTADFALFNDTTKDAFAEGHVVFQDAEDVVHGERMSLNLVTNRGTIENGTVFIKKGNFFLTGEEIEKTGESSYKVHQGIFTTCILLDSIVSPGGAHASPSLMFKRAICQGQRTLAEAAAAFLAQPHDF